jgi:nucleotide-binding universal stress UspA family protein
MSLKTIVAAPFFSLNLTDDKPTGKPLEYAAEMARSQGAHLTLAVSVLHMRATSAIFRDARAVLQAANRELEDDARTFADKAAASFGGRGITGDVDFIVDDFDGLCRQVVTLARAADVTVLQPESSMMSLQQSLLETLLFDSGRPVIVAPPNWGGSAAPERIIVSWDGSAKSARAVGDALPLLQQAQEVEIVSVTGDPNATKRLDGASIARHLARHCKSVHVTQLKSIDGDVAKTLGDHAAMTRANMIVMGAYAHSRLRQFILGGVTDAMIHNPPVPVFMSY